MTYQINTIVSAKKTYITSLHPPPEGRGFSLGLDKLKIGLKCQAY